MTPRFGDLQIRNRELSFQIDNSSNPDELMVLKRELYNNKLEMLDIIDSKNTKNTVTANDLFLKVESMKPAIRYETGLYYLDKHLNGGFEVGSLIMFGGQSTAGKTHTTLEILSNISKYAPVVFFNFEMGDRRIYNRLHKKLQTEDQKKNFRINSESRRLDDLIMEIKLQAEDGVVFFAIDSRMKIIVDGNDSEYIKIAQISKRLSEVAIHNDLIVMLINQVSEENLKTKTLSFKGSGDQMYDADMALFLTIEEDESRQIVCAKNRQDEILWHERVPPLDVESAYQDNDGDDIFMPKIQ